METKKVNEQDVLLFLQTLLVKFSSDEEQYPVISITKKMKTRRPADFTYARVEINKGAYFAWLPNGKSGLDCWAVKIIWGGLKLYEAFLLEKDLFSLSTNDLKDCII